MNDELDGGPAPDTAGEQSIADALRSAWDEQDKSTAGGAEPTAETTEPTTPAPSRDDGRDQRGRFAAKQAAEAAAVDPASAQTAPPAEPAAPDAPAAPAVEAPQHWEAGHREMFAKLPPDGQRFLMDRHKAMEGDYTRNMQAIAPLRKAAEQWAPYLQQFGPDATADKVFNHLLNAEYQLRNGTPEQKTALFHQWAKDYGITLGQAAQPPADDVYVDPTVAALKQELDQIKAWKNQRDQAETQHRQRQEQQAYEHNRSIINDFTAAKTEAGAPAHPHFEAVRDVMSVLLESKQAADIKAAYDMAVWARPDLRQQLLTAQQDAAARKAAEEARARAQKAGAAAASITGTPVGNSAPTPAKSVREELERAFASARA